MLDIPVIHRRGHDICTESENFEVRRNTQPSKRDKLRLENFTKNPIVEAIALYAI